MARRYRRKKNTAINIFFTIILLFLIGILCYKIYMDKLSPEVKNENKTNNTEKDNNTKETKKDNKTNNDTKKENDNKSKESTPTEKVTNKPSSNEKTENKNEQARRGGSVNLELLGDENVTISKGSKYNDAGVKATYSDGSDASVEVDIDNAVDTSKSGTYTVTYSAGNVVIIRRVTVE